MTQAAATLRACRLFCSLSFWVCYGQWPIEESSKKGKKKLYSENYKMVMKEIKDDKQMERDTMFLDWKDQVVKMTILNQHNL